MRLVAELQLGGGFVDVAPSCPAAPRSPDRGTVWPKTKVAIACGNIGDRSPIRQRGMFPRGLPCVALGSGQLLNEHVAGLHWPSKQERKEHLHMLRGGRNFCPQ
jgi:hypothetical protein